MQSRTPITDTPNLRSRRVAVSRQLLTERYKEVSPGDHRRGSESDDIGNPSYESTRTGWYNQQSPPYHLTSDNTTPDTSLQPEPPTRILPTLFPRILHDSPTQTRKRRLYRAQGVPPYRALKHYRKDHGRYNSKTD